MHATYKTNRLTEENISQSPHNLGVAEKYAIITYLQKANAERDPVDVNKPPIGLSEQRSTIFQSLHSIFYLNLHLQNLKSYFYL